MTDTVQSSESYVNRLIDDGKVSARQLGVVALCLFFNMLDGFDITAMAVIAPIVSGELGLSPDRLGWIFSAALAGMMAGAMLLAPVSDIVGRRYLIIFSVALVGISILFTATADSWSEFIILRFISGVGAGAMLASQAALAAESSPEKYRAFAVLVVTSGYPLGAMMTSVVAPFILPDYGWRGMFWFGGGLTLAMVLVAWAYIPESLKYLFDKQPRGALSRVNRILAKLNKATLSELPNVVANGAGQRGGFFQKMLYLLHGQHRKTTLVLWSTFFLCFSTLYFLMSWIPKLFVDSGYTNEVGHQAFLLFNLGGVLGIYTLGWMSTRWPLTHLVFMFLLASAIVMAIFASLPNQLDWLLIVIFVIGILQQGGFSGLYGTAAKVYPTEIRSTGIGWAIGLGRSGAVVGPAVAGYLIAGGVSMAGNFYIFAVPMVLGGLIAFMLKVR